MYFVIEVSLPEASRWFLWLHVVEMFDRSHRLFAKRNGMIKAIADHSEPLSTMTLLSTTTSRGCPYCLQQRTHQSKRFNHGHHFWTFVKTAACTPHYLRLAVKQLVARRQRSGRFAWQGVFFAVVLRLINILNIESQPGTWLDPGNRPTNC